MTDFVEALNSSDPTAAFLYTVWCEIKVARKKFPGDNCTMLALMEEVGELAKAAFSESALCVTVEAMQVACMAARMATEGDTTLKEWREKKGLVKLPYPDFQA